TWPQYPMRPVCRSAPSLARARFWTAIVSLHIGDRARHAPPSTGHRSNYRVEEGTFPVGDASPRGRRTDYGAAAHCTVTISPTCGKYRLQSTGVARSPDAGDLATSVGRVVVPLTTAGSWRLPATTNGNSRS